jgi:hypothetical protein
VIGSQRFTFDIWGEAVNVASLMETHCLPGLINISESTARQVETFFELESRGLVEVKHDRMHQMYFLDRLRPECRQVGRPLGEDHQSATDTSSQTGPHPDIMARRTRLRA